MVFGGFSGISKYGFWKILRDIQPWFLEDFKGYPNMVFGGFVGISKHGFWRVFRNIQV
jgi:hypothetical protein